MPGSTVQLSKTALFREVGYVPHPGQALVHTSKAPRRVLACGARWGKTTCGAMEAAAALLQPSQESLGWVIAPTYETSEIIFGMVLRTLQEKFPHRLIEHAPREHRLVVRNLGGGRSELRSKSAEDSNSLVGAALDFAILDEAARLAPRVWENHVSQRLLDRNGWALMLSTPRGCNWFRGVWKLGQKGRDARFESWASPTWENPHVDREWIEAERTTLKPDAFAQEYQARWLGAELEPCEVCGGPSRTARCVIMVRDDEEPAKCGSCGQIVNEDGKTAVPLWDGKIGTAVVIRICSKEIPPPGMPPDNEPEGRELPT